MSEINGYVKTLSDMFEKFKDGGSVYASYDYLDAIHSAIAIVDGYDKIIAEYKQLKTENERLNQENKDLHESAIHYSNVQAKRIEQLQQANDRLTHEITMRLLLEPQKLLFCHYCGKKLIGG